MQGGPVLQTGVWQAYRDRTIVHMQSEVDIEAPTRSGRLRGDCDISDVELLEKVVSTLLAAHPHRTARVQHLGVLVVGESSKVCLGTKTSVTEPSTFSSFNLHVYMFTVVHYMFTCLQFVIYMQYFIVLDPH